MTAQQTSPRRRCGFSGTTTVSEAALRAAVRQAAMVERGHWLAADGAGVVSEDAQFGHLVRYWLACLADIPPATLTSAQARAIDPSLAYESLFAADPTDAAVAGVREELLAEAPETDGPANLDALVDDALRMALGSRTGAVPWSAAFVAACVRSAAIALGLEGERGGRHVGRDALLIADAEHRVYVKEAHARRFARDPREGTYHAFRPDKRPVQGGDIVVLDRAVPESGDMSDVVAFASIPTALRDPYPLHGDIVVEVTATHAEAIGGNLCYREAIGGDLCYLEAAATTCAVRRRLFPLHPDGTLVTAREQIFAQEDDSGSLPTLPLMCADAGLHARSTGRVFALLSPVPACATRSPRR